MKRMGAAAAVAGAGAVALSLIGWESADEQAQEAVYALRPGYTPWLSLPSLAAAVPEPVLFGLQAAFGAALICIAFRRLGQGG
ncbi:MAG: energy-coupling factor ABC transporter substrate-binding protein [Bryobacteraceae bacterium]